MELVDLNELIAEDSGLFEPWMPKHIELQVSLAPNLPLIIGDKRQLRQAVSDMLVRGAIATAFGASRRGVVILTTSVEVLTAVSPWSGFVGTPKPEPGRYVCLAVRDSGDGMDDQVMVHLYDPHLSVRALHDLELASLLRLAKSHDGIVQVQSGPCMATTFKVFLPVVNAHVSGLPKRTAPALAPA